MYKQRQAIDRLRQKAEFSIIVSTLVNDSLKAVTSFSQASVSNNNISFSRPSNKVRLIITPTSLNLNAEISQFIKKKMFSLKKKRVYNA